MPVGIKLPDGTGLDPRVELNPNPGNAVCPGITVVLVLVTAGEEAMLAFTGEAPPKLNWRGAADDPTIPTETDEVGLLLVVVVGETPGENVNSDGFGGTTVLDDGGSEVDFGALKLKDGDVVIILVMFDETGGLLNTNGVPVKPSPADVGFGSESDVATCGLPLVGPKVKSGVVVDDVLLTDTEFVEAGSGGALKLNRLGG